MSTLSHRRYLRDAAVRIIADNWITVNGTPVMVNDQGTPVKGPAKLKKALKEDKEGPSKQGKETRARINKSEQKTGERVNIKKRDEVAKKEGFKDHKDKQRFEEASRRQDAREAKDDGLADMRKEFADVKSKVAAIKQGLLKQDGHSLTAKGVEHAAAKDQANSGFSRLKSLVNTVVRAIGERALGKDDFDAITNIPSDAKARLRKVLFR